VIIRKLPVVLTFLSLAVLVAGLSWKHSDPGNSIAIGLYFIGWMSTLLAVGYVSTPSNSGFGKVTFGCVVLTMTGIAMKVFHILGANSVIIIGLLAGVSTYVVMWVREKD